MSKKSQLVQTLHGAVIINYVIYWISAKMAPSDLSQSQIDLLNMWHITALIPMAFLCFIEFLKFCFILSKYAKAKKATKTLKFRAELFQDVINLSLQFDKNAVKEIRLVQYIAPFDPVFEIEIISWYEKDLMRIISKQVDSHVILQTIQPVDQYTGERNYELVEVS